MPPRETSRERAAERIAAHLLSGGLAKTSLRQLAEAAGTSDRMLLYYFADKGEVLAAAMGQVAARLAGQLQAAIPVGAKLKPGALIAAASAFTIRPEIAPYMRLWIEVVAGAARGEPPFPQIAQQIAAGFLGWIEAHLEPAGLEDPQATAAAILAMIDGLALLAVCAPPELVARAAGQAALLS